jgi:hypothetical protein
MVIIWYIKPKDFNLELLCIFTDNYMAIFRHCLWWFQQNFDVGLVKLIDILMILYLNRDTELWTYESITEFETSLF